MKSGIDVRYDTFACCFFLDGALDLLLEMEMGKAAGGLGRGMGKKVVSTGHAFGVL